MDSLFQFLSARTFRRANESLLKRNTGEQRSGMQSVRSVVCIYSARVTLAVEKGPKMPNFLLLKTQDFQSMLFGQGLILHNSRSAQAAAPFHKVNGFNRGHFFLLFILAVNLFVNFQKWSGPLELR